MNCVQATSLAGVAGTRALLAEKMRLLTKPRVRACHVMVVEWGMVLYLRVMRMEIRLFVERVMKESTALAESASVTFALTTKCLMPNGQLVSPVPSVNTAMAAWQAARDVRLISTAVVGGNLVKSVKKMKSRTRRKVHACHVIAAMWDMVLYLRAMQVETKRSAEHVVAENLA